MKFTTQLFLFVSLLALIHNLNADNISTICKGRYNGVILSDADQCDKFYVCWDNEATEYNCDSNFHFDINSLSCMSGSDCKDTEIDIPSSCTEGSLRAVNDDCYLFDICVKGQYQKVSCPNGYYFYAPNSVCKPVLYDANYKCNCVLPDHTLMANRDNCETFYVCEAKQALLQQCPLGQYYTATKNACLPDLEGICLMEPTKTPTIEISTELEEIDETEVKTVCGHLGNSEAAVFQPHDNDCSKFVMCVNGAVHVQQCPQNFYYDSTLSFCVHDTENKCQNGVLTVVEQQHQAPVIAELVVPESKPSNYIPIHNKLFSRFMKY